MLGQIGRASARSSRALPPARGATGPTLQLGVDPARALVLRGVTTGRRGLPARSWTAPPTAPAALRRGDCSGPGSAHRARPPRVPGRARRPRRRLVGRSGRAGLDAVDRERLAPDLAALSLTHAGPGSADGVLDRRAACHGGRRGVRTGRRRGRRSAGGCGCRRGRRPSTHGRCAPADLGPAGAGRPELGRARGRGGGRRRPAVRLRAVGLSRLSRTSRPPSPCSAPTPSSTRSGETGSAGPAGPTCRSRSWRAAASSDRSSSRGPRRVWAAWSSTTPTETRTGRSCWPS